MVVPNSSAVSAVDVNEDTTMAEGQSMTVADVVAKTMDGRLEDFVREAVVLVTSELMEAEISSEIGAGLGEVAPAVRLAHRNGYRPRKVDRLVEQLGDRRDDQGPRQRDVQGAW